MRRSLDAGVSSDGVDGPGDDGSGVAGAICGRSGDAVGAREVGLMAKPGRTEDEEGVVTVARH